MPGSITSLLIALGLALALGAGSAAAAPPPGACTGCYVPPVATHCQASGFDGVWFDNVDGFTMDSGFPITSDEQLTYNATLANDAHALGLGAAFNNDPQQTTQMVPYFDWVMYETTRDDVGPCFYSH